ncbi:SusD/RagB family nutrient-binding outer membrane lipoprotein [Arcticibacter sp. MXS-1]|uniref:SusD/RagB family nutrient-binding outer membrane lipoprotein n=1 Tax=Arcticibacter sp. MXS-1 TaxID=3341726 RepID=UPI0035A8CD58
MLNNDRVRPSYWNVRTFLLGQPAVYAQTATFSNGTESYKESSNYTQEYWTDFYSPGGNGGGVLGLYRAMERAYGELPEAEKQAQDIFMQAGKVVLIDEASKMVDMWGDIPFSKAGSLPTSSTIVNAPFDDQVSLYKGFIADLDKLNTFFATAATTDAFKKYDILLSGNVSKWQRYVNSLRLRLLMRTSNVDENTARTEILKMLASPATYPLVDGDNNGSYNPATSDILLRPLTTNTATLNNAYTEGLGYYAPDYMLNKVMLPTNDPRIPVLFDKYFYTEGGKKIYNTEFKAMPVTLTEAQQGAATGRYSVVDSTTFLTNAALPGIVITASEVNFIKAEAYLRWGSEADARVAYETAVRQSITFYFYLHTINTSAAVIEPTPSAAAVNTFIAAPGVALSGTTTDKLKMIITQKWLHFGSLQSVQAWSEYRRTNYPALTFPSEGKQTGYTTPPTRLLYPSSEVNGNSDNYEAVKAKDTRTTKIFWDVN